MEILIYQNGKNDNVEVKLLNEDIYLSLNHLATLFERDKSVISRHIKNIFTEQELDRNSTVAFFATVQNESGREVVRQIEYYNLDVIIAIGYRVNSKVGTKFRIWANNILKEYLKKNYVINVNNLSDKIIKEIHELIDLSLSLHINDEVKDIIKRYSRTWENLIKYDNQEFALPTEEQNVHSIINYSEAKEAIILLKEELVRVGEASALFGIEHDERLKGIIKTLDQTFDSKYLYPSLKERAARLLYFIIKDHPFTDGNKRIASLLFLLYIKKAKLDIRNISNQAMTTLTIMIAESDPNHIELMVKLVANLIE